MSAAAAPEFVRPAWCWVPPHASSAGADAVALAASAGLVLDPWQAWAVEQILAENDDFTLASFEAAVIVSRQNGKGAILEALALYWLFLDDVELILWSAHEFKTAAEAFRRMRVLLQAAEHLWPLVGRITTAKGGEAIELTTGQRLMFVARSGASGRGFTGDRIVLDEAYDLDVDEIAAMIPTLATRPDPQIIYTSSAGKGDSNVLRAVRDRGRGGGDPSLCWLEWCASPSGKDEHGKDVYDLDDRAQWQAANPGFGVRISAGFVAKERRAMSSAPERFARERLGVWDEPEFGRSPVAAADWQATAAAGNPSGRPGFFLAMENGMRSTSIGVAALDGDHPHVELADHERGTDWVADRVQELHERHPGAVFGALAGGPVAALVPELERRGVELELLSTSEAGQACGHLQKLVSGRGLTHADDLLLTVALAGAVPRDVGQGLWCWDWRKSSGNIAPLVAVTGALWLLEKHRGDKSSEPASAPVQADAPSDLYRPVGRLSL